MELLTYPYLTVVVAHMDDESLFCGGLLMNRCLNRLQTSIIVITDPLNCNRLNNEHDNASRAKLREQAFYNVVDYCDPSDRYIDQVKCLKGFEQLEIAQKSFGTWPVLTHGPTGEYGHADHVKAHMMMRDTAHPLWCFSDNGLSLRVDWVKKKRMLEFYRYGCTRTREWIPWKNSAYRPWCGDVEHYQKHGRLSS